MYILVEIIHTEFQYISLIEIEKELRKEKQEKNATFCPGCQKRDIRVPFCPGLAFSVGKPGQQGFPNRDKSTFL